MTRGIKDEFVYVRRSEKGVQSPDDTLRRRSGSCRDFAVLMMEAVRSLGLAARFVSGYIFVPDGEPTPRRSAAARRTPGCRCICREPAGSISIRPTASSEIATSFGWRWPGISERAAAVGQFIGPASSFRGMDVDVSVVEASAVIR